MTADDVRSSSALHEPPGAVRGCARVRQWVERKREERVALRQDMGEHRNARLIEAAGLCMLNTRISGDIDRWTGLANIQGRTHARTHTHTHTRT